MTDLRRKTRVALLAAGLVAVLGGAAAAGIDTRPPPKAGGQLAVEARELAATCYQKGTKIFEGTGFRGVDLGTVLAESTVRLSRDGSGGASVIMVPLADAVCFVTAR